MNVVRARNVNDALHGGLRLLIEDGYDRESRDGPVRTVHCPVTTCYRLPDERVLFGRTRDANPYFHLFEAMWMLSGSRDARWLDTYVRNFSARYGEESGEQHGAYGHRWRAHFPDRLSLDPALDQLYRAASLLQEQPGSRQVVLSMWDPTADLGAVVNDRPCNTHAYLRCRDGRDLDLTVCCRSNDAIMGAYGANAVHMSVMQEYVAVGAGLRVGAYYQVSNDFHYYLRDAGKIPEALEQDPYAAGDVAPRPLFVGTGFWTLRLELTQWLGDPCAPPPRHRNPQLFEGLLCPMALSHSAYRARDVERALRHARDIAHEDWRLGCLEWLHRRRIVRSHVHGGDANAVLEAPAADVSDVV